MGKIVKKHHQIHYRKVIHHAKCKLRLHDIAMAMKDTEKERGELQHPSV